MAEFATKRGLDIPLAGEASDELRRVESPGRVCCHPSETVGLKPRLLVEEGEQVKKGTPLFESKAVSGYQGCASAAGTITAIRRGARRSLDEIEIQVDPAGGAVDFGAHDPEKILSLDRQQILDIWLSSGMLALIQQRPFSRMADPAIRPKSIFVNGMNTACHQPLLSYVMQGDEEAFQAGINVLHVLTDGFVHLCL